MRIKSGLAEIKVSYVLNYIEIDENRKEHICSRVMDNLEDLLNWARNILPAGTQIILESEEKTWIV